MQQGTTCGSLAAETLSFGLSNNSLIALLVWWSLGVYRVSALITQREEEIEQGAKWQGGRLGRVETILQRFFMSRGVVCVSV